MPLTDLAVRNAKPRDKDHKLPDGEGMYLFVHHGGGKSFRLDYRFAGKRQTITLGRYPDTPLATARDKRLEVRRLLAAGTNPAQNKKLEKVRIQLAAATTFQSVGEALIEKWQNEGQAENTLNKKLWLFEQLCRQLGDRPIAEIEAPELLLTLRSVEKLGKYETVKRLRILSGQIFRFAIAESRARRDPSQDLRGALISPTVKHYAAIHDPDRLGELLCAIDGYNGHVATVIALASPIGSANAGDLHSMTASGSPFT